MGVTQTAVQVETAETSSAQHREFFYYPAYGHEYEHKFPNGETKKRIYGRKVVAGVVQGNKIYVGESTCFTGAKGNTPEEHKVADQFNKKNGRKIALGRAWKAANVKPESASHIFEIPAGTKLVGKLFVEEVEKHYPKHIRKEKKEEVTTS